MLCPVGPKFSGDVGEPHGSAQLNFELDRMILKMFDFYGFWHLNSEMRKNRRKSGKCFGVAGMSRKVF